MATSNKMRALNRLPYDFEDGLLINGVDVTGLNKYATPGGASTIGFTPVGDLSSTNVQNAIAELESEKVAKTHLATASGASSVGFTPVGNIATTNVQAAIAGLEAHKADLATFTVESGAAAVGFAPIGNINGATVQAAIAQLDNQKQSKVALSASSGSSLIGHSAGTVKDSLDQLNGPTGASFVGYTPVQGGAQTSVDSRLKEHDAKLANVEGNLNFATLENAVVPLSNTDLLLIRQGTQNKKIEISVARGEFATTALAAAQAAQESRIAAEAARDAAQLSAGIYATTADGLAATTSGRYFSVPSTDSTEYLILYLNNSGTATAVNRYPAVSAVTAIEGAVRRVEEQPNLFTRSQLNFTEMPNAVGVTPVVTRVNGLRVASVTTETTNGTSRIYWRFPVSMFPSGLVSAQITLMTDTGGSSGSIQIVQRNSSNVTVQTNAFATGITNVISSSVTYRTSAPVSVIAGTTAYVELDISLNKSSGDKTRTWTTRGMMIADGDSSAFRFPPPVIPEVPKISFFPNPALTANKTSLFEATTTSENNETVLELSGAGTVKQVFYETPAIGVFAPGNSISWSMDVLSDVGGVGEDADITIISLDAAGITIGASSVASITSPNIYQTISTTYTIPVGTSVVRFRLVKRAVATTARFRRPIATSSSPLGNVVNEGVSGSSAIATFKTVFVSTTGSDANDGSFANPLKTLSAALASVSPAGRIVMRGGDYSSGASITGFGKVEITAYQGESVRFVLGEKLTGITKTVGYTKVYQAVLTQKPLQRVWEHDTPDGRTLISTEDRHPLQRGRKYRLPSTYLDEVASIAAIDTANTPAWYWSNGILYFSASDGGNAAAHEYRVPTYVGSAIYGGTGVEDVKIENISVWYAGVYGFDARRLTRWEANNCAAICGAVNGFSRDDTRFSIERLCEAAGNGVDGFNSHRYETNQNHEQVTRIVYDNWSHDNGDDGDSLHEDNLGTYYGGLYEYNGDRGIATSYGAHTVAYGTVSRHNGQMDPVGGEGFCAIGAVDPANDNGIGTQMDCYGCQSYGNRYNYLTGASDAKMTIINSKSKDAKNTHFAAFAGTIKLIDCGASGYGAIKYGAITVENTSIVV